MAVSSLLKSLIVSLGRQCFICIYSLFLAFCLAYSGFLNISLTSRSEALFKIFILLSVIAGFALSVHIRCIIFNILPSLVGSAGRSYLWVLILGLVVEGPLANMQSNWTELSLSFTCYYGVIKNITMINVELMTKPERQALHEYKTNQPKLTETTGQLHHLLGPIDEEIHGQKEEKQLKRHLPPQTINRINRKYKASRHDSEEKRIEKAYKRKLEFRCEGLYQSGIEHCKKKFSDTYHKCRRHSKVMKFFCSPFKLDVLCNILKIFPKMAGASCNKLGSAGNGIGNKYVACKSSQGDIMKEFDVNMDSDVTLGNLTVYKAMMSEMEGAASSARVVVSNSLKQKRDVTRILLFFCQLIAFYSAIAFYKGYVSDIQYENSYINNSFRQIDCSRAAVGKKVVYLLRRREHVDIIEIDGLRLSKNEKKRLVFNILIFAVLGTIVGAVFCLDYTLYKFVNLNTKHFDMESTHVGHHAITPHVKGTGVLGKVVRTMMAGFNQTHHINKTFTTRDCKPKLTKVKVHGELGKLMAAVIAFIIMEPYIFRTRIVICGWCFPEIEILRAKFLYRVMMQKRIASK